MIRLPDQVVTAMVVHAENCHPRESCGLIATDSAGEIRMVYPLTNALRSRTNYTIEPREHFKAQRHADASGWEITGVFHSHPHTEAFPSPTDVRLAPDPGWLYVLVGLRDRAHPEVRGFRITDGEITEETLVQERNEP